MTRINKKQFKSVSDLRKQKAKCEKMIHDNNKAKTRERMRSAVNIFTVHERERERGTQGGSWENK